MVALAPSRTILARGLDRFLSARFGGREIAQHTWPSEWSNDGKPGHRRLFSTCKLSSFPLSIPNHGEDREDGGRNRQPSTRRSYHASPPSKIVAPFIPEMILFVVVGGGWVVYRTSQGKPLTPDEALLAQDAYRKQEERLRLQGHQRGGQQQKRQHEK